MNRFLLAFALIIATQIAGAQQITPGGGGGGGGGGNVTIINPVDGNGNVLTILDATHQAAIPVKQPDVPNTGSVAAQTLNSAYNLTLGNGVQAVIYNTSGITAGTTITVQGSSNGGSSYAAINGITNPGGVQQSTTTAVDLNNFCVNVGGLSAVGLRVSTAGSAGTVTVTATGTVSQCPAPTVPTTVTGAVTIGANSSVNVAQLAGTTTSVGNGASDNGTLRVAVAPNALTTFFLQPAASDNHTNIKNGAGTVYSVIAFNNSATVNYLRFYNAATGFNGCNSATGLVSQMQIPASTSVGGFTVNIPAGLAFSTGISICVTSGYATTDTTNATATAMSVTVGYL